MMRYGEAVKPAELKRLLDYDRQQRDQDDPDLSKFVTTVANRS